VTQVTQGPGAPLAFIGEAKHRDRRPGIAELRRLQHLRDLRIAAGHDAADAVFGLLARQASLRIPSRGCWLDSARCSLYLKRGECNSLGQVPVGLSGLNARWTTPRLAEAFRELYEAVRDW
jgi:hypothetical protein